MKAYLLLALIFAVLTGVRSFMSRAISFPKQTLSLRMDLFSGELDTTAYAVIAAVTIIPSFAFVKFVGDQADSSRDTLSSKTKAKFKKALMETPNNLGVASKEEEILKEQIKKAYMQDKDVDVAILEEKLRLRQEWRKEMMTQVKGGAANEDEDGW